MTPLVFITGVMLGTCASIAFGLLVVMLLFWLLGASEPQVANEWVSLGRSTVVFFIMTMICAVSFIALLKKQRWRWPAQALMWLGVVATVAYYTLY